MSTNTQRPRATDSYATCPSCAGGRVKVVDMRPVGDGAIRRRRLCDLCQHRWTTYERQESTPDDRPVMARGKMLNTAGYLEDVAKWLREAAGPESPQESTPE